jgi:hypothetical protein
MTRVVEFYSVYETKKPPVARVCHNDNACPSARVIPLGERRPGNGGYRLCSDCR